MIKAIGGRKIAIGLLILIFGSVIDFTLGLSTNLTTLLVSIGVGFFLGNGVEHVAVAIKARPHQGIAMGEVEKVIRAFDQKIEALQSSIELTNRAATAIIEKLNAK